MEFIFLFLLIAFLGGVPWVLYVLFSRARKRREEVDRIANEERQRQRANREAMSAMALDRRVLAARGIRSTSTHRKPTNQGSFTPTSPPAEEGLTTGDIALGLSLYNMMSSHGTAPTFSGGGGESDGGGATSAWEPSSSTSESSSSDSSSSDSSDISSSSTD